MSLLIFVLIIVLITIGHCMVCNQHTSKSAVTVKNKRVTWADDLVHIKYY